MVDARDKEFAAFTFAQQIDAALEAKATAGQHDDCIGSCRPGVTGRRGCDPQQPSEPQ
jgi:hypothetical protein